MVSLLLTYDMEKDLEASGHDIIRSCLLTFVGRYWKKSRKTEDTWRSSTIKNSTYI
jgi:hypothetical protein